MASGNHSLDSTSGRILVIDDDAALCKLVARFLSAEGFQVETVRTFMCQHPRISTKTRRPRG
jgi:DNA-binding response OmpR family regulator